MGFYWSPRSERNLGQGTDLLKSIWSFWFSPRKFETKEFQKPASHLGFVFGLEN